MAQGEQKSGMGVHSLCLPLLDWKGKQQSLGMNAVVSGLLSGYPGATPQGLCEVGARQRGEAEPRESRTSLIGSECQKNRSGWRGQSFPQAS